MSTVTQPQIPVKIDLGHILTIGTMLVTIGMGWGSLSAIREKMVETSVVVQKLADKVDDVKISQAQMDERMKSVERQLYRFTESDKKSRGANEK